MVGLGSDQGEKWPKPERESDLASGSRPKSGPNPSGKASEERGAIHGADWPPERRRSALSIFSCTRVNLSLYSDRVK